MVLVCEVFILKNGLIDWLVCFKLLICVLVYKNIVELNKGFDCFVRYVIYEFIKVVFVCLLRYLSVNIDNLVNCWKK